MAVSKNWLSMKLGRGWGIAKRVASLTCWCGQPFIPAPLESDPGRLGDSSARKSRKTGEAATSDHQSGYKNDYGDSSRDSNRENASNAVEVEEIMTEQTKAPSNGDATKPGKLDLAQQPDSEANGHTEADVHPGAGLVVHAQGAEEIEIAESFTSAGVRPIAASHLDIYGTILNNRPIMASHLHVLEYSLPGNRPIFASEMVVRDDLTLPGGRPIMASDSALMEASMIMGGRPIASNEIDDSEALMGFLD